MIEIVKQSPQEITLLDGLAKEAQYYSSTAASSMLQLGRVLCEAKGLVRHGEWGSWIQTNAGFSERTAQQLMQVYKRFDGNGAAATIRDRSKLFKLLALPEGTEEAFLETHDVSTMSSRDVEAAVRQVRAEMQAEIDRERAARKRAEEAAQGIVEPVEVIPAEVTDKLAEQERLIDRQNSALEQMKEMQRESIRELTILRHQNAQLNRDVEDRDEMLAEAQKECDRIQNDLLNLQSAAAKGDAERIPTDELTLDVLASAVRQFIGACARMPYMQRTFAAMTLGDRNAYDELLRTVEGWAAESRKALSTYACEEV